MFIIPRRPSRIYSREEFASGFSSAGLKIITNIFIADSMIIRADRPKKVERVSSGGVVRPDFKLGAMDAEDLRRALSSISAGGCEPPSDVAGTALIIYTGRGGEGGAGRVRPRLPQYGATPSRREAAQSRVRWVRGCTSVRLLATFEFVC